MTLTRTTLALAAGTAVALSVSSCRLTSPPTNPAKPAGFAIGTIGTQQGTAFVVAGELADGKASKEILNTVFRFKPDPNFGSIPDGGEVKLYRKSGAAWVATTVVSAADNVRNPNRPTIADVDGDGRNDFIVPAGWVLNSAIADNTGSITWWRNNGNGTFTKHVVIDNNEGAFEGVVFVDLDADGIKDIVSSSEDYGNPFIPQPTPAVVKTLLFKGTGGGNFAPPVVLCNCGSPLPVVFDVNSDGRLDIGLAQFLGVATVANPAAGVSDESFVWLENTSRRLRNQQLGAGTFAKHVIARGLGESVQILPVDNLDGDFRYAAIGVNQVNPFIGDPTVPPQVVRLTPGADLRAEWNVSVIEDDFTLERTYFGQTSPGPISEGDMDGDGDIDLVVPGSADNSVYWLERRADGSWLKHDIAAEFDVPRDWGLAGVTVADLDNDGRNEIAFSAYYEQTLNVVTRKAGTGGKVPAVPRVPDPWMPY